MDPRYWRIRARYGDEDVSRQAWERDECGVWYGAWSAEHWRAASVYESIEDRVAQLEAVPEQQRLEQECVWWSAGITRACYATVRRFADIAESDWVVFHFDDALHLARMCGELTSRPDHPLNRGGELFKYRRLADKKSFRLGHLPDPYRLIPPAGRGNVHEFGDTNWALVRLLADSTTEGEVTARIGALPRDEWLDLLGPGGWESFCLGYLILREGFVPAGLDIGRTLPVYDIVGRARDGARIVAQCKKAPYPALMPEGFISSVQDLAPPARAYFFAFSGCPNPSAGITVVDRSVVNAWIHDDPLGSWYVDLFCGIARPQPAA